MMRLYKAILLCLMLSCAGAGQAVQRRPVDARHPLWMVHVDVWNKADPQKIIDLVPVGIRPWICMNLSLSCQYDREQGVYRMPQNAVRTYKSWASVCQQNGLWFTCQPASGGHSHLKDDDIEIFEYFFRTYPNFLGWNYCEQFWGFNSPDDPSSSSIGSRLNLFARLVKMSAHYGGFLTVSYCGGSHPLSPLGMLKSHRGLLKACKENPEAILWLYKYTTCNYFHNNESVTYGPFISGLAGNYGVRYDSCGWQGTMSVLRGKDHGVAYPTAAGIGTVLEQTCVNGGAVWDGPELIWTEDFRNLPDTETADGFKRRNWTVYPSFSNAWLDLYAKIVDGSFYIPMRDEVLARTKVVFVNDITEGTELEKYAAREDLYDGLYLQEDPFNPKGGHGDDNRFWLKRSGRYATVPVVFGLLGSAARTIPVQVKSSEFTARWPTVADKVKEFDRLYPEVSKGDLFVSRHRNQLVVYTPYSNLNDRQTARGEIPLLYNTCRKLVLQLGPWTSGVVREKAEGLDVYLNNFGSTGREDTIAVIGATSRPSHTLAARAETTASAVAKWDAAKGAYVLRVTHDGPVDVRISCAGSNRPSRRDPLPERPLAADPPARPPAFAGELVFEAEDMDRRHTGALILNPFGERPDERGHAGNGFVEFGSNRDAALRHVFKLNREGAYRVTLRYLNPSRAGNLTVSVNGVAAPVGLKATAPNGWQKASVAAKLRKGENTFLLTNPEGLPATLDQVVFRPSELPPEKFRVTVRRGDHGTAKADRPSAAEGERVTLAAVPDKGYAFVGWEVVHGGVTVGKDDAFVMPDDIVTVRPLFADKAKAYALDFKEVRDGMFPSGWRAVEGNGGEHAYPGVYMMGPRTFLGFRGTWKSALYWRDRSAEYGAQSEHPLALTPGRYRLTFACAAWKGTPKYRVRILDAQGNDCFRSGEYDAAPSANGDHQANLSAAQVRETTFGIVRPGNYRLVFEAERGGEFLLLQTIIQRCLP